MPYTLLRVTERGVVLFDYHVRRLALENDSAAHEAFLRFAREAAPGVWSVWSGPVGIRTEPRAGSRLRDGMPARLVPSPVLDRAGVLAKSGPPSPYDAVRLEGVATLLTSAGGQEILESCSAAVVAWVGERLVCAPRDRPRVWSTAEAAIRDRLEPHEAPIPASSDALLLVNAVKGTCALAGPLSRAFPVEARSHIEALFEDLTTRPPLP